MLEMELFFYEMDFGTNRIIACDAPFNSFILNDQLSTSFINALVS